MCEMKRHMPPHESDDGMRRKRFRPMLLDDWKKDAVLNVNGVRVPVHREVLAASSAVLTLFEENIPVTGSSVETVRYFTRYLYGFNVFENEELSINEALELAKLFIQFHVRTVAVEAAHYCLRRCTPAHLNELCRVFATVKEIHAELAKHIVENYYCVNLSLVGKSILHLVVTSLQLTELQKLIAIGKWTKANSDDGLMKQLFGRVYVVNACER